APGSAHAATGGARDPAEGDGRGAQESFWRGSRRVTYPGGGMSVEFSVVVPVCNEAENVEPLAREIHAALETRSYEMIFVDDGSTDATAANLARLKSEFPTLRVLRHSFRSGQSAAVASGVRAARAVWIATLDGDGQNDPADIPKPIAARDENRGVELFMGKHKAPRRDTAFRKLQSGVAHRTRAQ